MEDNIEGKIDRFKAPIVLSLVGIVLIIGGIFTSGLNKPVGKTFPKESIVLKEKEVSIDISGAVASPGVYKLTDGARIEDAVKAAGGFSDFASKEYIAKTLNLAQKLSDGSKVYIPSEGEDVAGSQFAQVSETDQRKVNINSASQAQLEALSGIGPVTATKIKSFRPYQKIEELISKKVIGKALFEKIKDQLVVY